MQRWLFAALCSAAICGASLAQAITFKFDWRASSGLETSDTSMAATGFLELDTALGATFTPADLMGLSISVSGNTIRPVTFTDAAPDIFLGGTVSRDGQTASLTDIFVGELGVNGFGCDADGCRETTSQQGVIYNIASGRAANGVLGTTRYGSAGDALDSFVLERFGAPTNDMADPDVATDRPDVTPVPNGGAAVFLITAIAGLVLLRRRRGLQS